MNIGIFYNPTQVDRSIAKELANKITEKGGNAVIFSETEEIANVDRLIILGGDGTVLHAARRSAELGIPIVGVNYGRLGFLTEFERGQEDEAVKLLLDSDCLQVKRSMIETELNGKIYYCLNEVSLMRGVSENDGNKAIKISAAIDGSTAGTFYADGLIVTTPTGSTAYSLSAGGSIMTPECKTFQITPVCAFSLRSRPIAYPDSNELQLFLPKEGNAVLFGDGIFLGDAGSGDVVKVRKANRTANFLTRSKTDYFRRLTEKIN